MSQPIGLPRILFGIIGAIVGGVVGYYVFGWMLRQGLYGLILPPALLGLAGGYCIGRRSIPFAVCCGVAGLGLALFTEWKKIPFAVDDSFLYFITHLQDRKPLTLIMFALGTIFSYRLALGIDPNAPAPSETPKT